MMDRGRAEDDDLLVIACHDGGCQRAVGKILQRTRRVIFKRTNA